MADDDHGTLRRRQRLDRGIERIGRGSDARGGNATGRRAGNRSIGGGIVWTSSGKMRCATSRSMTACFSASVMSSACLEPGSTV